MLDIKILPGVGFQMLFFFRYFPIFNFQSIYYLYNHKKGSETRLNDSKVNLGITGLSMLSVRRAILGYSGCELYPMPHLGRCL
jgi:hypothetical protein